MVVKFISSGNWRAKHTSLSREVWICLSDRCLCLSLLSAQLEGMQVRRLRSNPQMTRCRSCPVTSRYV